ncbi:MAG: 23S rRNA (uracil(747)-C(5))-methyltransferase [Micrococcales bacterium]|nr:MAG: 23S rRNA (uracil(747)-C(5))-methyltransferase [Micrococcales bacterium]PIE26145.1 MAG: 23S rRNA (uracil(747)-C(5))-methyltransferase [Micrococcales bacterium]
MLCDYFDAGVCGSCTLMGQPYPTQVLAKQARCQQVLSRAGVSVTWKDPVTGPESGFRNKAKLAIGGKRGAVTVGITDQSGHGVDLRHCGLYEPDLAQAVPAVAKLVNELKMVPYDITGRRGELKFVLLTSSPTGELMVRFVARSRADEALLRSRLPRIRKRIPGARVVTLNVQPQHKAVLEGDQEFVLSQESALPFPINDVELQLHPGAFLQTNKAVAAELYRTATRWIVGLQPREVLDLFCGVGAFALHLAAHPKLAGTHIRGVDVSQPAVRAAQAASAGSAAEFTTADLTDPATLTELPLSEVVVINPPRRGLGELAGWLERSARKSHVRHVLYSSCSVPSLARDLAAMPSWRVTKARMFDMFPHTEHQEVLLLLTRKS